ncbi:uroporphyrinogen-III C-methyltransferase [Haliea atlantica]|nr:uroporphyrinogen III [Haliea sp.]MAL95465.1 uroporphyrinogen III [Haliea sp.]
MSEDQHKNTAGAEEPSRKAPDHSEAEAGDHPGDVLGGVPSDKTSRTGAESGDDGKASGAEMAAQPARRGGGPAWLALLLALAAAGGAGWLYWQGEQSLHSVQQRLQSLEEQPVSASQQAPQTAPQPQGMSPETRQSLDQLEQSLEQELNRVEQRVQQLGEVQPIQQRQAEQLRSLEQQLSEQRRALGAMTGSDRDAWLLAEVEYLLRLANQRLLMTGDVASARGLLASADGILRQLDDAGLHAVRRAVASDRAALRAVPSVDVEGIYLRLAALVDQIAGLEVFELPQREETPTQEGGDGWKARLQQGYQQALAKLSDYIAIRRREAPVEALVDPQLEDLMRQNTAMLLQQAQIALMSGNQRLYDESLQRTRRWISEFFLLDERVAESVLRELDALADEVVAVSLPDLRDSLQALDAAQDQRLLRQEEE